MKKLLTLAIALAAVASLQAASMTWTLAQVKTPASSTTAAPAGWLAYLFSTADTTLSDVTGALDAGDFSVLSDAFDSTAVQGTVGLVTHKTDGGLSANQTFQGFVIVLDAADTSSAKNYLATSLASKTVNAAGSDISLSFGVASSLSWNAMSVPEPATGALALAGVALLFRRRRA